MATTGRKRVGQGKAKKASRSRNRPAASTSTETAATDAESSGTKEFPQVGDGIRTHRGAAAGWKSGRVKFVGDNGAIIATVDGVGDLGLERGSYEPSDGNLPRDRHAAPPPDMQVVNPVIGPPGPVLGEHPSAGAGQTLPQGRHLRDTGTGQEVDDAELKENDGPSMTAGPAPKEGESFAASAAGGAPEAHPAPKVVKRLEAERTERKKVDRETSARRA